MEQMYMIEIFIDKLTVYVKDGEESTSEKNLIIRYSFGPNVQFLIKEGQLVETTSKKSDTIEVTPNGRRQYSRTLRVGKSFLFPSYPDTVLSMLSKFPLSIEVWTDDENEPDYKLYVGVGTKPWHTEFFHYLKETSNACKLHESLTLKDKIILYQECCCGQAGEVSVIVRLSALGSFITTEFQQIMDDPDKFCFRTDKTPSMFECKRIEGDNPNFVMVGSLYETTTLEDPDLQRNAQTKVEVCTELQSCGLAGEVGKVCSEVPKEAAEKKFKLKQIRMGDITGPCGNTNCALAHKVRQYIRNLDSYKAKAGDITQKKAEGTRKICGRCDCKDDTWHREICPESNKKPTKKDVCGSCQGETEPGDTCEDRKNKHYGTGNSPKDSKSCTPKSSAPDTPKSTGTGTPKTVQLVTEGLDSVKGSGAPTPKGSGPPSPKTVQYVTEVPHYRDAMFKRDYIVENCQVGNSNSQINTKLTPSTSKFTITTECSGSCGCDMNIPWECSATTSQSKGSNEGKPLAQHDVYNVLPDMSSGQKQIKVYNVCTEIAEEKECRCSPPKPTPPCKTFDCDCIPEIVNASLRKQHKPYCPLYRHKANCPVTMIKEEEGEVKEEFEDEAEPLPYGLPPIQLGPCPVMGRPCSVPDGFARMYRNAVLPTQPESFSAAGKVCCSTEFERIKKAIKEYLKYQKDNDLRCVNRYNVDTEKRCCDKEQALLALMGRSCCGTHKLALQEEFKKNQPKK